MNGKSSTLLSLGISIALIAGTIWLLFNHQNSFGFAKGRWFVPHHMMAGGGGMGIVMILFWAAVIAAIAMIASGIILGRGHSGAPASRRPSDAVDILKRRYAGGEIDKAQYRAMKQELRQQ